MTTNVRQSNGTWVPVVPSPNNTIATAGNTITDAAGYTWGVSANGVVIYNGTLDYSTNEVLAVGISNGNIYQINQAGNCYEKIVNQWTQTTVNPFVTVGATGASGATGATGSSGSTGSSGATGASAPSATGTFSIRVSGHNIIDGTGTAVQLRGVNIDGLEGIPFSGPDPWRGQAPNFAAMKTWGINVVRIPLSESNWLGLCSSSTSTGMSAAVYQQTIQTAVNQATALGIYVILDLHWIIENGNFCPEGQNAMADSAYSPKFWGQVAAAYKNQPAVMFELFNEPQGNCPPTTADWNNYINGQLASGYDTNIQTLVNVIRSNGATNVIIVDGLNYASTFGNNGSNYGLCGSPDQSPGFFLPNDTLNPPQLAAAQHYYHGNLFETGANVVLNKGIPILVTEYGDDNSSSTATPSVTESLYGWADPGGRASQALTSGGSTFPGVSYVAWTWNFGYGGWSLIADSNGDTSGSAYANTVKAHYQQRAGI